MQTSRAVIDSIALANELRAFIAENFLFGRDPDSLGDDTSFLESGILDSTGLLELIGFIERTYAIRLADEELVPENLDSVRRLCKFLARKLANDEPRAL